MKNTLIYIILILIISDTGLAQNYRAANKISSEASKRIKRIEKRLAPGTFNNPVAQFDINTLLQKEYVLISPQGQAQRFKADTIIHRKSGLISWVGKNISTNDWVNYVINLSNQSINGSMVIGNEAFEVFSIDPSMVLLVEYASFSDLQCGNTSPPPFMSSVPRTTKTTRMAGQDCNLRGIFAYTPAVRSAVLDIRGLIQAAIDFTNLAYDNSLIDFHLEPAFVYETDYVETGDDVAICWSGVVPFPDQSKDLCRFHHTGDGWMDEVHDYRDQYKADVCILFVDSLVPGKGGESFLPPVINQAEAFAVVLYNNIISTTAHEIGHIQGCHHDYAQDPTWTNNHGYVHIGATLEESFRTVMAYPNQCINEFGSACREIPYFSHHEILFEGVNIGETDEAGVDGAMNAINIMNQKALVNGFRDYPAINTLPSTTIPSETYAYAIASNELGNLTSYVIEDSSDVHFSSENYIQLRPGFQSHQGAFFEGTISTNCDPPYVQPNDFCSDYGFSVDSYGKYAVVGHPTDENFGFKMGAVYLYERVSDQWQLKEKITPPNWLEGKEFGYSVAIYDTIFIVGAPGDDGAEPGGGRAYIYKITDTTSVFQNWVDNINATSSNDRFGHAVDVTFDRVMVGCPGDTQHGVNSGSVVGAFKSGGLWFYQGEYYLPNPSPEDQFGYSVNFSSYRLNVGVPGFDSIYQDQGKVVTFINVLNSWSHFDDLYVSELPEDSRLGHSVDQFGNRVITGAPGDSRNGLQSGSAYIFRQSGASMFLEEEIIPDDLKAFDRFGFSVAIDSADAIVGSPKKSVNPETASKVYTYSRIGNTWSAENILQQPAPLKAIYAHSISISDSVTIVSALSDFPTCDIEGAVHSYIQAPNGFWILEPGDLEASARQVETKLNSRQDERIRRE